MAHTILLAEDDFIAGVDLCDTCEEAGYTVAGPHAGLNAAMLALQKERPDLAIVDFAANGSEALALADRLSRENVPIIFQSLGEWPETFTSRFPRAMALPKPCPPAHMIAAIERLLSLR
jgi:two-component system, response regulator PdtaR